nr:hypothetical protein [Mycoplasmopsis bovis]
MNAGLMWLQYQKEKIQLRWLRKIQEDIKEIFDIPVSIGISYSKWAD